VVLVSKDINMRIKARAWRYRPEDYFNDKVLEDTDLLYSGVMELPRTSGTNTQGMESWQKEGPLLLRVTGPLSASMLVNQFVWQEDPNPFSQGHRVAGNTATLVTIKDFSHHKNNVWGITARNREQNFALTR